MRPTALLRVATLAAASLVFAGGGMAFAAAEKPAAPVPDLRAITGAGGSPAVPPLTPGAARRNGATLQSDGHETMPLAIFEPPIASAEAEEEARKDPTRDLAYGAFQRGYYLTALAIATARAKENDPAAQTLLGVLYERGIGVSQSVSTSASWYNLAAEAGDPQAAYRLGLYYLLGTGVKRDEDKAAELFEKAAESGLPAAQYNLGVLYMEGRGRPFDRAKATELFEQAARDGDKDAQYSLALSYIDEQALQRDERQGAFWMGRAARSGHVAAQVRYGIMRFNGVGVEPDQKDAAQWFERAAAAGNPVAMNRLARLYAHGLGVDYDPQQAAIWHLIAREAGVSDLWLDGFVGGLDDKTVEEASRQAGQWKPAEGEAAKGSSARVPGVR